MRQPAQHFLGQIHQVTVVGIGLIKLHHGEFRIVPGRQTLVAEIAVNLVDALKTTHHQSFQVQLRRYTQVQTHIKGMVVGLKWPRSSAAWDRLHHWRFHLDKSAIIEKMPDKADNPGACGKCFTRNLVHDQVQITLPIAHFLVFETVELGWQWPQRLG